MRQAIAQWLEVADLEDTTRERCDDLIRLYILPTLGDMQARQARRRAVGAVLRPAAEVPHAVLWPVAGRTRLPALSGSTARKIHYIIRGALERAVR